MFRVKAAVKCNPSFQASPTQTRTYTHVYPAKHGPVVSGCLFMLSQSTWAVAWPANHNICRLVLTTVLTPRSPQSVPDELTDFGCSGDTSAPERTNQSCFTSGTRYQCPRPPTLPSEGSFLSSAVHESLERVVRERHNESDRLFTLTIMSWFGWGEPQLWSFHRGTRASVRPIMNRTMEISIKHTLIKRSPLQQTCMKWNAAYRGLFYLGWGVVGLCDVLATLKLCCGTALG